MPFEQPTFLPSPTGATLRLFSAPPSGRPRGVVQVNHGLAEHAGRYRRFAAFLAQRGYAVYAHDHRGHGGTRAPGAPLGTFAPRDGAAKVIADVLAVHARIGADHPDLPVIVFGHSMGGLVALNFAMRHSDGIAGAAIWNANVSAGALGRAARAILAWERFRLGSDVPSRLLPRLTFRAWGNAAPNAATPFDWLSRDEREVARYVADPLCGWDASVGLWRDVFRLVFDGADDAKLRAIPRAMPFHLLGGSADPSTANGAAVKDLARRLRKNSFPCVVSTVHEGNRHESLNELNRERVMADFAGWADGVVASAAKAL